MTQATVIDFVRQEEPCAGVRVATILNKGIYGFLLFLVGFAPIPYGTVEPWWKAAFVCFIFSLTIVAIIERLLSGSTKIEGASVLLPMLVVSLLALVQTISLGSDSWIAISADPYQTRFVFLQLLSLTALLALLYRYANTETRIRALIYLILGIAVVSACYGMLRQTLQHSPGFILPLLKPNQGYGQFINKNHFAFLMEMAFGLGLGLIIAGGLKRERVVLFIGLLMPVWTGLVLSNSRGGILAMLAQVVVAALLVLTLVPIRRGIDDQVRFLKIARSSAARTTLIFVLLIGVVVGVLWVGGDRLLGSFDSVGRELNPNAGGLNEGATRNEIWRATVKMFAAHPILGVGLGGYWVAITQYHQASGTLTPQEAHNDYLELLSGGGVIGFILGIWFIVVVLQRVRQQLNSDNSARRAVCIAALLGITGVAVHSLVDFGLHMLANATIFIVLVMMATADTSFAEQDSRRR